MSMKRQWTAILIFVLAVVLILTGCAGQKAKDNEKEDEGGAPQEVQEEDKFGGTFQGRIGSDPPTLDPAFITDTTSSEVADNIFDGLVQYDKELNVVGALAKDWEISEDGLIWKFNLHDNVKFHNGRKMTAEDLVYSFTRIIDPKTQSPRANLLEYVKGAKAFQSGQAKTVEGLKALDEQTFEITLDQPFTPFLSVLAMSNLVAVPKEEVEKYGKDFTSHPIGTGAFKFVEWMHDDHVTLEGNADYFEGRPYLDKVVYRVIIEDAPAFAEYEQGNIHVLSNVPEGELDRVVNGEEFKDELIKLPQLGVYYIGINNTKPILNNLKVRQAIAHSINKKAIAEVLRQGTVIPADTVLPPGMPGYSDEIKGPQYDVAKAKSLMAEAGYANGLPGEIELAYNTSKNHQSIAEAVQADLKEIGINAKLINMDWGVYITKLDNGETQLFRNGWIADYPDPDNFLDILFHSRNAGPGGNASFYKNPKVDQLLIEAKSMKAGDERWEKYHEVERIVAEEVPIIPLYYFTNIVLRKPFVNGFIVTGKGVMPLKTVWLNADQRQ